MEFRRGTLGRRHQRRICPRCQTTSSTRQKCKRCGAKTEARIEIVWYVDGKRERELTHCWREQDAAEILRRKEADYWRQQELGVERDVGGTLGNARDAFIESIAGPSGDYRKQITTALRALGAGTGWEVSVLEVTPQVIEQFKRDGLQTLSPSTVRSYMLVLRRFFSYLHDEGWIRRNPTRKVKMPAAVRARDHLRPEEVGPVLQAFWELWPEIAPIATAFMLGGWRKGELINLRHRDTYLAERWAYVLDFEGDELTREWSPKTESSRRAVPLHPLVARALSWVEVVICPDGRESPWVFPILDQRKRRRRTDKLGRRQPVYGDRRAPATSFFGDKLRETLAHVGIERRVTIHGLRRTFAVLLQETGAPDAVIRQALGHAARGVTEAHYLPRRDAVVQRWVDAIEVSIPAMETSADTGQEPTVMVHDALPTDECQGRALPPIRHQSGGSGATGCTSGATSYGIQTENPQ